MSKPDSTDGLVRLLSVAFRRYAREPASRTASARHILATAVTLYAEHTSPADAALAAAEAVARLAQVDRVAERNRA